MKNTEGLSIPKLTGILTRNIPKSLFHIAFDAPLFPAKEFVMHSLANAHKKSMEDLATVFLNPEAMRHMFQSGTALSSPVLRKKAGKNCGPQDGVARMLAREREIQNRQTQQRIRFHPLQEKKKTGRRESSRIISKLNRGRLPQTDTCTTYWLPVRVFPRSIPVRAWYVLPRKRLPHSPDCSRMSLPCAWTPGLAPKAFGL